MLKTIFMLLITTKILFAGNPLAEEIRDTKKECSAGNAIMCNLLGDYYQAGAKDNPDDYIEAFKVYLIGCNKGKSALSCFNTGVSYNKGLGTRQNTDIAKEYFGKACDLGAQDGCKAYAILNKRE